MGEVIEEEYLRGVRFKILHEVAHSANVDIVVTGDATHICGINGLVLFIVPDELHAVKPSYRFSNLF
jgi:hypothetical protein